MREAAADGAGLLWLEFVPEGLLIVVPGQALCLSLANAGSCAVSSLSSGQCTSATASGLRERAI